jgi:hypothetical protein
MMGTIKDIHNLLIDVGRQAYREGRKHQKMDSSKCHIPRSYICKQTPKCFEDTKIYATILEGYIETDS